VDCYLRPATETDREFMYALYCRTMRAVVEKTWGWDEAWQRIDFNRRFSDCSASVIEYRGVAAGALMLESKPDSIYIQEIQVLPEYQGQGIGTAIVKQVVEQAASQNLGVTLSVVPANPRARQLYERLGFRVTHFDAPFFRMRHDSRVVAS
jgi:ribosomal protein S18 acetylase RimI-like enzyme